MMLSAEHSECIREQKGRQQQVPGPDAGYYSFGAIVALNIEIKQPYERCYKVIYMKCQRLDAGNT